MEGSILMTPGISKLEQFRYSILIKLSDVLKLSINNLNISSEGLVTHKGTNIGSVSEVDCVMNIDENFLRLNFTYLPIVESIVISTRL